MLREGNAETDTALHLHHVEQLVVCFVVAALHHSLHAIQELGGQPASIASLVGCLDSRQDPSSSTWGGADFAKEAHASGVGQRVEGDITGQSNSAVEPLIAGFGDDTASTEGGVPFAVDSPERVDLVVPIRDAGISTVERVSSFVDRRPNGSAWDVKNIERL